MGDQPMWEGKGVPLRTLRSPEMLAPARIPVAAGKNTAKTPKKHDNPSVQSKSAEGLKSGTKFVMKVEPIVERVKKKLSKSVTRS